MSRLGSRYKLSEGDLKVVCNILYQVSWRWREIGVQLKLSADALEGIGRERRYQDDGQRLIEVLRQWLNNVDDPPPSWPVVVRALHSNYVNAVCLAEEVRRKHCPEYDDRSWETDPPRHVPPPPQLVSPPPVSQQRVSQQRVSQQRVSQQRVSISQHCVSPERKCLFASILAVIALCIVFAFGGIALISVGIRGLSDADECSLGPSDAFNSLNLISGFVFLSGLLVTILAIIYMYLFCKEDPQSKRVIIGVGIGLIAVSIVFGIADMIYAFYVASHVLQNVEKWERNKTLCNEAVFRSSFDVIVTYFLMVSIIVAVGAIILSHWVFKKIRSTANDLRLQILTPLNSFFR